jgi:hypothetical protein
MAGGIGRRFGGDKQVEPVGPRGEPLGAYTAFDALAVGFDQVVLVTRPGAEREVLQIFRDALGPRAPLWALPQRLDSAGAPAPPDRPRPWGTAHAALAAAEHVDTRFGIANADDAYGRNALRSLHDALTEASERDVVLVTYRAGDVLSTEGGVSRGWVRSAGEGAVDVTEVHDLRAEKGDVLVGLADDAAAEGGVVVRMPRNAPVSMNLWGLTPGAVQALRVGWSEFVAGLAESGDRARSAEYGLSTAFTALARQGRIRLRPVPGGTDWFGMTFAADRARVADRLAALHADGTYPVSLADAGRPKPHLDSETDL